jgi:16S rRNA U1498 N3-methylase RsmE
MSLPRFFISFEQKQQDLRIRDKECVNQLSRVLRMKVGEELILLDNTGMERVMRITSFSSKEILGVLVSEEQKKILCPMRLRSVLEYSRHSVMSIFWRRQRNWE